MRSPSELSRLEEPRNEGESAPAPQPPPDDCRVDFSALVRAEFEWVWRVLRRIGLSPADAEDATQQVFIVAARRFDELRVQRPRPFLYAVAIRVAANALRTLRRRREEPSELLAARAAHEPASDELVEQRRARALLDELLGKLPEELRRVLVLAEIEQLTAEQIAELEALPSGTVRSRLRRARAAFHDLLERQQRDFSRRRP
jgi:RNA polymerase sigma-70 factor (ECF subfamily)